MPEIGWSVSLEDKRPRTPFWQARIYIAGEGGRERRWSTGIRIADGPERRASERLARREAEERAGALAAELAAEPAPVPENPAALKLVARRMLEAKVADRARPRWSKSLAQVIDALVIPHFGATRDVRTIRRADLEAFKAALTARTNKQGDPLAPVTINNALTAIRQILGHALEVDELLDAVPVVRNVRISRETCGVALEAADVAAWTRATVASPQPTGPTKRRGEGAPEKRNQRTTEAEAVEAAHLLAFLANTGIRRTEALAVRFSWVDWSARLIRIPAAAVKGGRERKPIAINETCLKVLRAREKLHPKRRDRADDRVFRNSRRMTREATRAAERAGLGALRLHDLRHTRASQLLAHGATLRDVADAGGWQTLEMVQRYAHGLDGRAHDLAAAVELGAIPGTPAASNTKNAAIGRKLKAVR